MSRFALSAAWRSWQRAAGPWAGWAVCPCLMLEGPSASTSPVGNVSLDPVGKVLEQAGTAVVLDIDPIQGVELAAAIHRQGLAYAVLVLPRWPHAAAVLDTQRLTSALVAKAARLATRPHRNTNVVFVVDAKRRRRIARKANDPRVDNRYDLTAGDLPNLATLQQAGIQRIVKISAGA